MGDEERIGRSPSPGHSRSENSRNNYKSSRSRSREYSKMKSRQGYVSTKSRSRSLSRDRKNYSQRGHGSRRCSNSRSRSNSPKYQRSRSPLSYRKRHIGDREHPRPSRCLGVFGLSSRTTESQIYDIFSKYGPVDRVEIVIDAKTKSMKGFCFVYFNRLEDAEKAKKNCAGMEVAGRFIRVDYSITQRAHTPTPGIYMGKPTNTSNYSRRPRYRGNYRRSPYGRYRQERYHHRSRSGSYSPRRY